MITSGVLSEIQAESLRLGFNVVGITSPDAIYEQGQRLEEFISDGRHGDMEWLASQRDKRSSPRVLWPAVNSVIALGMNYGPKNNPLNDLAYTGSGVISVYAQGKDYHAILKGRVKQLAQWLLRMYGGDLKVFVDTAPVMEKPLAEMAGIGWQGRHTNLVSREFGSWLFLAEIFTTLELPLSEPAQNYCGSCIKCVDACPTQAINKTGKIDPRRCISYLTIEHKGHISGEFREAMGNRIYGCDDCLAVCPWNKFSSETEESKLAPRSEMVLPSLAELVVLDDISFRTRFSGSPIKRIGRDRFVRNVLIAIGNSKDSSLYELVYKRLKDDSPIVRAMAVWALGCIAPIKAISAKEELYRNELDADVIAEWKLI